MAESKNVVANVITMITKITDHKLDGSNYLDWNKIVRIYLQSIKIDDHPTKDLPTNNTRQAWMRDDV